MAPGLAIEHFNAIEDIGPGLIPGFINAFSDPLFFQCTEERFGHRIIVGYYSALRPHDYNGGLPTNESESRYWKTLKRWPVLVDHITSWSPLVAVEPQNTGSPSQTTGIPLIVIHGRVDNAVPS